MRKHFLGSLRLTCHLLNQLERPGLCSGPAWGRAWGGDQCGVHAGPRVSSRMPVSTEVLIILQVSSAQSNQGEFFFFFPKHHRRGRGRKPASGSAAPRARAPPAARRRSPAPSRRHPTPRRWGVTDSRQPLHVNQPPPPPPPPRTLCTLLLISKAVAPGLLSPWPSGV